LFHKLHNYSKSKDLRIKLNCTEKGAWMAFENVCSNFPRVTRGRRERERERERGKFQ